MKLSAYVALAPKGVVLHVLELPGCFVRAKTQAEAIEFAEQVVLSYLADLKRHEPATVLPEKIELAIDEIDDRSDGGFDPGDSAALFTVEYEPAVEALVERTFKLASYNRQDLLELTQGLSEAALHWQADEHSFSIARIMRHIGSAEQWYYSRLVELDRLRAEWEDDDQLALPEFLKMSRRTVEADLRALHAQGDPGLKYPEHFTTNTFRPDRQPEAWTLRKVLRRLLEHEREHIAQIRDVLAGWRALTLTNMSGARSDLLWALRGLDESRLSETALFEQVTTKDILAHLGFWDDHRTGQFEAATQGLPFASQASIDPINDEAFDSYQGWDLDRCIAYASSRRQAFLEGISALSDALLHQKIDGDGKNAAQILQFRIDHDRDHLADFEQARRSADTSGETPVTVIRAILRASFADLETLFQLIPERERDLGSLSGDWNLRDIIGHLLDWERLAAVQLQRALAGLPTQGIPEYADEDSANAVFSAARQHQGFDEVWEDYRAIRTHVHTLLDQTDYQQLNLPVTAPWGDAYSLANFFLSLAEHDREHAADIRAGLFPSKSIS